MDFLRTVKPRSFAEWVMLALVFILVILTAVLVLTRQFLPERNEVRLQALTEAESSAQLSTVPEPTSAALTESRQVPTERLFDAFPKMENLTRRLSRQAFDRQLKLFRDFSEKKAEEESEQQTLPPLPEVVGPAPVYGKVETEATADNSESNSNVWGPESVYTPPTTWYTPAPAETGAAPAGNSGVAPTENSGAAAPEAPAAPPSAEGISTAQANALALTNQARAAAGLPALAWDGGLQGLASVRAAELASSYSHYRLDGSYITSYCNAENICWHDNLGNISGSAVFNQFFNSPDHHAIMMDGSYSYCAIGIYAMPGPAGVDGTGKTVPNSGRYYVSMVFR